MPIEQLLESMIDAGVQVDGLWSMYIVVNLGLFWFFFLMQRPLIFVERLIAFVAYAAFAVINGNALTGSYRLLEALRSDLVANLTRNGENAISLLNAVSSGSYASRADLILVTHGGAIVFVALLLAFRNLMIAYYRKHYPDYVMTPQRVGLD
ncbi:MAG: hypothetical protein NW215_11850 [Hyphomicrobiales bacterium]|nr:hypothetical protein [Hyphomicrobiales bacterium]